MGKSENFPFDFELIEDKPLGRSFEICLQNCKEEDSHQDEEEQSVCGGPSFASRTSSASDDHVFSANSSVVGKETTTVHTAEARRKGLIFAATTTTTAAASETIDPNDSETIATRAGLKQVTVEEGEEEVGKIFSDELRCGSLSSHQSHAHNLSSESAMTTTRNKRLAQWIADSSAKDDNGQQKAVLINFNRASTDVESPVHRISARTFKETSSLDHCQSSTSSGCFFPRSLECSKELLFTSLSNDKAVKEVMPAIAAAEKLSGQDLVISSPLLRDPDYVPSCTQSGSKKDFAREMEKLEQEWSLQKKNAAKRRGVTKDSCTAAAQGGGGGDCNEWFRQRLWRYLFDNLYRAIDELYFLCELQCDFEQMKEAMFVLEEASLDFQDLRISSTPREVHEGEGCGFDEVRRKAAPCFLSSQCVSLATSSARSSADQELTNPQKHQPRSIIWQLERRKGRIISRAGASSGSFMQESASSTTPASRKGTTLVSTNQRRPGPVDVVVAPAGAGAAAVERSFTDASRADDGEKETLFSINALKCSPPPPAAVQAATESTAWQRVRKKKEEADVNSVASSRVTRSSCNGKPGNSKKIFSSTAGTERLMRPTQSSGYRVANTSRQKRQIATKDQAWKEKRSWVDIFSARKPRTLNPPEKTTTSAAAAAGKCHHDPSDTSANRTLLCSRGVHAAVDAELFTWEKEVVAAEVCTQVTSCDDHLTLTTHTIPETRTLVRPRQELVGSNSILDLELWPKLSSYDAAEPHHDNRCEDKTPRRNGEFEMVKTDMQSCRSQKLQPGIEESDHEMRTNNVVTRKLAATKNIDVQQQEVSIEEEEEEEEYSRSVSLKSQESENENVEWKVAEQLLLQQEMSTKRQKLVYSERIIPQENNLRRLPDYDEEDDHNHTVVDKQGSAQSSTASSPSATARGVFSVLSGSRFCAPCSPISAQQSPREAGSANTRHGRTDATASSAP